MTEQEVLSLIKRDLRIEVKETWSSSGSYGMGYTKLTIELVLADQVIDSKTVYIQDNYGA